MYPRGSQVAVGASSQQRLLEKELRDLHAAEQQLDDLIQTCTVQLRLLTEDPSNQQYPSVRGQDGAGWAGEVQGMEPHRHLRSLFGVLCECVPVSAP